MTNMQLVASSQATTTVTFEQLITGQKRKQELPETSAETPTVI